MRRASGLWPRFEGVVLGARGVGYGRTPAVGMASQESPGANPAEREAFRDDLAKSYGDAYATRSSEEGYGERYGEAVKGVLSKKGDSTELQRGETAERDQKYESVVDVKYDTSQGEHVEQKEVSRHSGAKLAFEEAETASKRSEEAGNPGGAAT
ncbi:uncharacterized protein [Physcomitrium patens]|uniref:Uncharacterized protein n=1 Tax=Physcomitrium patens TaxID=3218 RepID=A9T956_PHYPA|nr:uncharacterized protein LOC112273347 [Physcomitrium patens]PNR32722.1 hypothetical protein PHYPA_024664 [Physcomitrium patens]|eukprot:XP_024357774.1 uncharacterized protein LOC112273347 [Physcomitrella patens]